MVFKLFFLSIVVFFVSNPRLAMAQILDWSTNNVQILRGSDYDAGSEERTIVTLEHAHGWQYGDTFMFLDWIVPDDGKPSYYGEISPRLSLSKIFDTNLSSGIIKDVLISTTLEKPKHQGPRYLYGGAIDFNVAGFKFFKTNAYLRDNTQLEGSTWQMTVSWNRPIEFGEMNLVAEGFADFAGREGATDRPNQLIVPRLLIDVGDFWHQEGQLFAGMEYSYWHNKFGIDGTTESVPQVMMKWVF